MAGGANDSQVGELGDLEHVIPQGFGRFGSNTPTLDCVCDDCNAYFSAVSWINS